MNSKHRKQPIGILDSGLGGLTIVKEIIKKLPNENLIYIGDTARVPYGVRSNKVITDFATQMVKFLLKKRVKILIIACNTISSCCLKIIQNISNIPVVDVIEPTIQEAIKKSKNNYIGVIATKATINSNIYKIIAKKYFPKIKIIQKACPLFVPLVEQGLTNHLATKLIAKDYLSIFNRQKDIDVLILGCTHYPFLKQTIRKIINKRIKIIDSASSTVFFLKTILKKYNLKRDNNNHPSYKFYFTDKVLKNNIKKFLGQSLNDNIEIEEIKLKE